MCVRSMKTVQVGSAHPNSNPYPNGTGRESVNERDWMRHVGLGKSLLVELHAGGRRRYTSPLRLPSARRGDLLQYHGLV